MTSTPMFSSNKRPHRIQERMPEEDIRTVAAEAS
jgi:hypothetical protein